MSTGNAERRRTGPVGGRVLRSPLGWLLVGVLGVGAVSAVTSGGPPVLAVLGAITAVAVYWAVMRFVARRPAPEIARTHAGRDALLGGLVGFGFIAVSMLAILAEFDLGPGSGDAVAVVGTAAAVSLGAAVTEELLFRGLALQALERLCGSWAALAVTAVLFGARCTWRTRVPRCGARSRSPSRPVSCSAPHS
jgi:uncharacterized protein